MRFKRNKRKYNNSKVTVDGILFDSLKEADRYRELKLMQRAGLIYDLELQKPFELIPAQYEEFETGEFYKRGEKKGQPKIKRVCVEHSIVYNADFCYKEKGRMVVEDTKSEVTRTKDYIIKRKLLLYKYGIKIKEI